MATSIIQLERSPRQRRKHFNTSSNSNNEINNSDYNNYYRRRTSNPLKNQEDRSYIRLSEINTTSTTNTSGCTSSNWSPIARAIDDGPIPYDANRYSNSLGSRRTDVTLYSTLQSPEFSSPASATSRRRQYLMQSPAEHIDERFAEQEEDEIDDIVRKPYYYGENRTVPSSSLSHLEDSVLHSPSCSSRNQNNNYLTLSNFASHSECGGSLQNVSGNSFNKSSNIDLNRSCDRYGFFYDDDRQLDELETPSIQSVKQIREKEKKWLQMLKNWRYYINYKWEKIRDRCRKGIPHSLRSQAWFHLCGAHLQKNRFPNLYNELLTKSIPDDVHKDIIKDLHRQFPNHIMFADPNGNGQNDLYNVLKAFAAYKPNMGYCQAQAPIAAVFLMHMPAERAFWCLVALSKYYIAGYFTQNLEEIQIHGQMLFAFIKKHCLSAYNLLKRQNIDPVMYMTEWFMCIYSRTLPWPTVLRVWDMFLCEGLTILFKVGLYLVELALKNETTKTCPTMCETYQKLRTIPKNLLNEEILIKGIKKFEIRDLDLLKEHKTQIKKFNKNKAKAAKQKQK